MRISKEISCDLDIEAETIAEVVVNSDSSEQADFFEQLAYKFKELGDLNKDVQLSHIVEGIIHNNASDSVKNLLEQMIGWFDNYEDGGF